MRVSPLLALLLLVGVAGFHAPVTAVSRTRVAVSTRMATDDDVDKKSSDLDSLESDESPGASRMNDGRDVEMKGIFDFEAMGKGIWGNGIGNLAWSPNKLIDKLMNNEEPEGADEESTDGNA